MVKLEPHLFSCQIHTEQWYACDIAFWKLECHLEWRFRLSELVLQLYSFATNPRVRLQQHRNDLAADQPIAKPTEFASIKAPRH